MGWKKVVLISLAVVLVVLFVGVFYFYNYYVFKEFRICIKPNAVDTKISCQTNDDCLNMIKENSEDIKNLLDDSSLPQFMKEKINEVLQKSIYCEETCKTKESYGDFMSEVYKDIDSCQPDEEEVLIKIRGKEGIQILKFLKSHPEYHF